jgi:drug/metabolite transporter (DMT)-like permease
MLKTGPMSRRAAVLFVALGVAWGIPYLLIKIAVDELAPEVLVLFRTGLAAVLLLPVALARGAVRPVLRRWMPLLAYTAAEVAVPWLFLNHAEQRLPSSTTGLLIATVPLFGVGLAFVTGRAERLGRTGWAGLVAGLVGVGALVGLDVSGSERVAVLQLLVVCVGYAIGPVILDRALGDLPAIGVVAASLAIVALVYLPIVLLAGSMPRQVPSADVLTSVVLLAVVCTAAAFLIMFALVGEIGPVRATAITYLNPAVSVLAGVLILDERITAVTVAGFVLVLLGSYLITRGSSARPDQRDGVLTATGTPVVP